MRRAGFVVSVVVLVSAAWACTTDPAPDGAGSTQGDDASTSRPDATTDSSAPDSAGTPDAAGDATDAADAAKCTPPAAAPVVVFLDRAGGTWTPGATDSRTNTSALVDQSTFVPAWSVAPASWTTLMACVAKKFEAFNVKVTDVDPNADSHIEIVFAPGNLSLFSGATSNGPLTCTVLRNSVAFVSTNYAEANLDNGCAAVASQVGYSLGLESVTACPDAMSFPQASCPTAGFTNTALSCGNSVAQACGCQAGTTQNSYARLLAVTGPACL
jgi:hypothetical protein